MNPLVFFILIIFSFSNSWGMNFSEVEIRKAWTETGYSFEILNVCDKSEKEIMVTRGPVRGSLHWLSNYRFVSLTQREPLDCESEESSSPLPGSDDKIRTASPSSEFSSTEPQALYVWL